jgi:hypothetical protein
LSQRLALLGVQRPVSSHIGHVHQCSSSLRAWQNPFQEFPPRMKPGSFRLDRVIETMTSSGSGKQ